MKIPAILSFVCLLLALNVVARVESRRGFHGYSMFVFGDSFADNGNLPKTDPSWELSRQWYYPYGGAHNATGRFSNSMVQSDFVASMLGHSEAPPAQKLTRKRRCDPSGMTFATGGVGVFYVPLDMPPLSMQVDTFESMVGSGFISERHLRNSVALVAVSGNDYVRAGVAGTSSFGDITGFIRNVTAEIAANVERLQKLGVKKFLVNNLHPLGCAPSQSRAKNYTSCDDAGNMAASIHNNYLKENLGSQENVLVLDLNTAFTNIVKHHAHGGGGEVGKRFKHKLAPCCESVDPKGYCGQLDDNSEEQYTLCDKPDKYFFWDDAHPTGAGWEAIMQQLEDPIQEFLGLN